MKLLISISEAPEGSASAAFTIDRAGLTGNKVAGIVARYLFDQFAAVQDEASSSEEKLEEGPDTVTVERVVEAAGQAIEVGFEPYFDALNQRVEALETAVSALNYRLADEARSAARVDLYLGGSVQNPVPESPERAARAASKEAEPDRSAPGSPPVDDGRAIVSALETTDDDDAGVIEDEE